MEEGSWHKTGFVLVGDALAVLDWCAQSQAARPLPSATSTMQGSEEWERPHSQSAEDQITRHGSPTNGASLCLPNLHAPSAAAGDHKDRCAAASLCMCACVWMDG